MSSSKNGGRLLMVAYYYPPDPAIGSARPARWVRYLHELGYQTDVLAWGEPQCDRFIHRVPHSSSRLARFVQRVAPYNERFEWAPAAQDAAESLARINRYDAIISTSPPLSVHFVAHRIRAKYGIPWVADFRDPVVGNPFRNRKMTFLYDRVLEMTLVRNADAVIANTERAALALRTRYPKVKDRIHLIWNGYDPDDTRSSRPMPPNDRRILVHAGSIYEGRHPRVLLAALSRLLASGRLDEESLQVHLIGPFRTPYVSLTESMCMELAAKGILRADGLVVSKEDADRAISEAHYLLLLDVNEDNSGLQVPAKLFEYLRVGRPILCFTAAGSAVEMILSRSGVRYVSIDPRDHQNVVDQKIIEFLALPPEVSVHSAWYQDNFNSRKQASQLAAILETLRQ